MKTLASKNLAITGKLLLEILSGKNVITHTLISSAILRPDISECSHAWHLCLLLINEIAALRPSVALSVLCSICFVYACGKWQLYPPASLLLFGVHIPRTDLQGLLA